MRAEFVATIRDGKVIGIVQANPPHELYENQIALTAHEFTLLRNVRRLDGDILANAQMMLDSIKSKVKELEK